MWTKVEQCTIGKNSDCYMICIDEGEQRTYKCMRIMVVLRISMENYFYLHDPRGF